MDGGTDWVTFYLLSQSLYILISFGSKWKINSQVLLYFGHGKYFWTGQSGFPRRSRRPCEFWYMGFILGIILDSPVGGNEEVKAWEELEGQKRAQMWSIRRAK